MTDTNTAPGYKSIAFYVGFVFTAISFLTASGTIGEGSAAAQIIGAVLATGTSAGYAAWRLWVKGDFAGDKPWYKRTEILLTLAALLCGGFLALGAFPADHLAVKIVGGAASLLALAGYKYPGAAQAVLGLKK